MQGQRSGSRSLILSGTLLVALPFLLFAASLGSDAGSGLLRAIGRGREGRFADPRLTAVARAVDRTEPSAAEEAIRGATLDFAARERGGSTILGYAVKRALAWDARPERMAIVRTLLGAGAPVVDDVGREGEPLVANVADSADPRTVELLDLLLAHGGDPDARLPFDPDSLLFSRNLTLEKARVLVRHGANLKALSVDGARTGWTALMVAAERGQWELALFLLHAGVPASSAGRDGSTALSIAEGLARGTSGGRTSGLPPAYEAFMAELGKAERGSR